MPEVVYEFRVMSGDGDAGPAIIQEFEVTSRPYLLSMGEAERWVFIIN